MFPLLVLGGKVAVKAALELAVARLGDLGRDGAPGEDVVKLGAVRAHDGVDVIGGLHAALELERVRAGVEKAGEHVDRARVARAQGALAPRRGP